MTSLSPRPPSADDDEWARTWLTNEEAKLWAAMPNADRRHAVEVSRRFLTRRPGATRAEMAGALLHDVGKVQSGLGTWGRVDGDDRRATFTTLPAVPRPRADRRQHGGPGGSRPGHRGAHPRRRVPLPPTCGPPTTASDGPGDPGKICVIGRSGEDLSQTLTRSFPRSRGAVSGGAGRRRCRRGPASPTPRFAPSRHPCAAATPTRRGRRAARVARSRTGRSASITASAASVFNGPYWVYWRRRSPASRREGRRGSPAGCSRPASPPGRSAPPPRSR